MNENEFGYRIRQALNEGAERLDYATALRLQRARAAAVARHRDHRSLGWLRTLGLAAPLLALVVGFIGIYEWQHQKRISELADMDFAVLLDTGPIPAYADKGFSVLLQTNDEL